jgi:hypothetical protein
LEKGEKRFSLFNVKKWAESIHMAPAGVSVVPTIQTLPKLDSALVDDCVQFLRVNGSVASPGFMKPEGVVAFHSASQTCFKVMLENDEGYKG